MFPEDYFCNLEARESKELAPGVFAKTFWGKNMLVSMVEIQPGGIVPDHSHPHEQTGVVITGEVTLVVDGREEILKPGQPYIIPGGVEHRAIAHAGTVTLIDVFSPVREDYQY